MIIILTMLQVVSLEEEDAQGTFDRRHVPSPRGIFLPANLDRFHTTDVTIAIIYKLFAHDREVTGVFAHFHQHLPTGRKKTVTSSAHAWDVGVESRSSAERLSCSFKDINKTLTCYSWATRLSPYHKCKLPIWA